MSWFSSSSSSEPAKGAQASFAGDANRPNFFPVTSTAPGGYTALTPKDTEWACDTKRGFNSETQTWYSILEDGSMMMVQIIWSYIGVFLVPANTQMTFKLYNPTTKKTVWRSVNAGGFAPGKDDRRACKANEFEIKHTGGPGAKEAYHITATLDKTTQISVTFERPAEAPGFKYGEGVSVFGADRSEAKRDGIAVHRFMPLMRSSGSLMLDGQVVDVAGEATFIHAIQGMRPNNIASRWNFCYFTTGGGQAAGELGTVRAVQMEFETTDDYGAQGAKSGRIKTNIGAIYASALGTQPIVVTGQTHPGGYPALSTDVSKATHTSTAKDPLTGYMAPTGIKFEWEGDSRVKDGERIKAEIEAPLSIEDGQGGLIEKVNVLAEIPYVIRKALSAVAGINPYIFQFHNKVNLNVTLPGDKQLTVPGWMFNEATFISP